MTIEGTVRHVVVASSRGAVKDLGECGRATTTTTAEAEGEVASLLSVVVVAVVISDLG